MAIGRGNWKVHLNHRVYYWNNLVDAYRFARMWKCSTPYYSQK